MPKEFMGDTNRPPNEDSILSKLGMTVWSLEAKASKLDWRPQWDLKEYKFEHCTCTFAEIGPRVVLVLCMDFEVVKLSEL